MSRRLIFGIVVLALLGLACGAPSAPNTSAPDPVTEPEADACASLDEMQCITSAECTLILPEGGREYRCRTAEGRCEQGFRQYDGDAEACEAKEGCRFVPGQCYCSPDVTCICGGGPPPQCVEAAADPAN
ncbi:MAG TPA: hypothetical protein VGG06_20860 [Thermoanaerobaculia bacterium]|jgi:hypothetical protein